MRIPAARRLLCVLFACALGLLTRISSAESPLPDAGAGSRAEEATAPSPSASDLADWVGSFRRTEAEAKELGTQLNREDFARVEQRWPTLRVEVQDELRGLQQVLESEEVDAEILRDQLAVAQRQAKEVDTLLSDVQAEVLRLDGLSERAGQIRRTWTPVVQSPAPDTHADFLPLIEAMLARVARVESELLARNGRLAVLIRELTSAETELQTGIDRTHTQLESLRGRALLADSPPGYGDLGTVRVEALRARGKDRWRLNFAVWSDYAAEHSGDYLFQLLLLLTSGVWLAFSRQRPGQLEPAPEFRDLAGVVMRRPLAAGVLIAGAVSPFLHNDAPPLHRAIVLSIALVAAVRLGREALPGGPRVVDLLLVLLPVSWVSNFVLGRTAPGRLMMSGELLILLVLIWRLKGSSLGAARFDAYRVWGRRMLQGIAFAAVAAIFLDLVGLRALARRLGNGALDTTFLLVVWVVTYWAIVGAVTLLVHAPLTAGIRAVQQRRDALLNRLFSLEPLVLAVSCIASVLAAFRIMRFASRTFTAVWKAAIDFGEVHISLGDLVTLGIVIWASVLLSRILRALLDDDVLPRAQLPSGVPYAISTTVHYLVLTLGGFLAFSAAGVGVTRFSVLAGAIGVGIGLGLQGVVNNFICGLVLLYERPIKVGDMIAVEGVEGEVKLIGIRSSTVRTWVGADVLVPNATLINSKVVNYTLQDRFRRVDLPVGVAYGSKPEQVLQILLGVALANERVMKDPVPQALFMNFGESTLQFELRAWVDDFGISGVVRSELAVALNAALAAAAIEIPFPQRDLHLRSVAKGILPSPQQVAAPLSLKGEGAGRG